MNKKVKKTLEKKLNNLSKEENSHTAPLPKIFHNFYRPDSCLKKKGMRLLMASTTTFQTELTGQG